MGKGTDLSEKDFESQVKDLAKLFGWLYYHTWRSVHSPAGFPDCVMVRRGRVIFAELKSKKGQLSEKQREWFDALQGVDKHRLREGLIPSIEVYLWLPSAFDEIAEVLR